jgi:hypothetical protein
MQLSKGEILEFRAAMSEYDQIREKDKSVTDITDERMLKLGTKVKYSIIKNHNHLKDEFDALDTILNDLFRKEGGISKPDGTGYFLDPDTLEALAETHKKDKAKFKVVAKRLQKEAEINAEKYSKARKALLAEFVTDAKGKPAEFKLHGLYPSADDVAILPEALISWYMSKLLFSEPDWGTEESETEKSTK